jgi:hypothetical protein
MNHTQRSNHDGAETSPRFSEKYQNACRIQTAYKENDIDDGPLGLEYAT